MSWSEISWVELVDALKLYASELLDENDEIIDPDATIIDTWEKALVEASWVFWALSGGRVHPAECWIESYSLRHSCRVRLLNGPLLTVHRAEKYTPCSTVSPVDVTYCVEDWNTVSFCSGCCSGGPSSLCGCHPGAVRIYYQTQSTLPPGTEAKVLWLAHQYTLAATGAKCQLPDRVTSITRQNVSWTLLDPMDFLDKGMLGVARIDSWLSIIRRISPTAMMIDPTKSYRLSSRRSACGSSGFNSDFVDSAFE